MCETQNALPMCQWPDKQGVSLLSSSPVVIWWSENVLGLGVKASVTLFIVRVLLGWRNWFRSALSRSNVRQLPLRVHVGGIRQSREIHLHKCLNHLDLHLLMSMAKRTKSFNRYFHVLSFFIEPFLRSFSLFNGLFSFFLFVFLLRVI